MKTTMNSEEYDRMYKVEENLWWYRGLRDVLAYYVRGYSGRKLKILDAGCGTGMNMNCIESLGHTAYGIDISARAVAYAKKRGLINVSRGSITNIHADDKSFDIVLSMDVIGLLNNEQVAEALNECHRVLKPGGLLFIHTAAFEFLRSSHDKVSHVQKRYTNNQLRQVFDPTKWSLKKLSYRMFFLFIPLAIIKFAKRMYDNTNPKGDLYIPFSPLNIFLYYIQLIENRILRYYSLPFGTSLFVIAKKK